MPKIQILIRITRTSSYLPMSEHLEESAETAACVNAHLCLVAKMMQMQIMTTQHTKASMQKQQRLDWDLAMLWSARVQQVEWDARAAHWLLSVGAERRRATEWLRTHLNRNEMVFNIINLLERVQVTVQWSQCEHEKRTRNDIRRNSWNKSGEKWVTVTFMKPLAPCCYKTASTEIWF